MAKLVFAPFAVAFALLLCGGPARAALACSPGEVLTRLAFDRSTSPAASSWAAGDGSTQSFALKIDIPPHPSLPDRLSLHEASCDRADLVFSQWRIGHPLAVAGLYRKHGPLVLAKVTAEPGAPGVKPATKEETFDLFVLSNPKVGRDQAFNTWYDSEHVPDVLNVPGFQTSQRFELVADTGSDIFPLPRYAVRFVFHSADLQATVAEVRRRLSSGITRPGPDFDAASSVTRYYEPVH